MNILIYDYEVFKYDTLLGFRNLNLEDGSYTETQTWDLNEIRQYYEQYKDDSIWVGWNSNFYDDLITEAIVKHESPYRKSKQLIEEKYRRYCRIKLFGYDLLNGFLNRIGLKETEALEGDSIETSEVDFNIDRPLTDAEKRKTEFYNRSDLRRTQINFMKLKDKFELRLSMIAEFNIPLQEGLRMTGTQIAAAALGAKRNPLLANMPVKPTIPPTLRIKNQAAIDWYLGEKFREKEPLLLDICNTKVNIAAGGAHSQCNKYHCKKAIYADISGYYNLVMMNFDLLPRTLDEKGKDLYRFMYGEVQRLKKINPAKRRIYKTICLSVFGAMNNEGTDFYDPYKALLVTSTGEMFMLDLLEKLDGLGTAFNVNTDGIMFEPFNWKDEQKIKDIIQEWVNRNGFAVKTGILTDYHGRDVNCYMMNDPDGEFVWKGEALKNYDISDAAFAEGSFFHCKEPPIIAQGLAAAFTKNIMPEEFVEQHKDDLKLFQYICKKNSYDYLEAETKIFWDQSKLFEQIKSPSRCFASNSKGQFTCIYKHKAGKNGKHLSAKVQSIPENVFIYNKEILSDEAKSKIMPQIDYDYYIKRIYKRIAEFL